MGRKPKSPDEKFITISVRLTRSEKEVVDRKVRLTDSPSLNEYCRRVILRDARRGPKKEAA